MKTYPELRWIMAENPQLFEGLTPSREVKFKKWLPLNMHIYEAFVRYANELKSGKRRKYYSARAIWERLRWDTMISDNPEHHYKMSDLHMPFVSWLVMASEPELVDMFEKRGAADNG